MVDMAKKGFISGAHIVEPDPSIGRSGKTVFGAFSVTGEQYLAIAAESGEKRGRILNFCRGADLSHCIAPALAAGTVHRTLLRLAPVVPVAGADSWFRGGGRG